MTTQPRALPTSGFQQTPSQPIPTRYGNQSAFNPGQAYSPRHGIVPSSSPHQSTPYFGQGGHPGSQHDLYKTGPGAGVPGTPPMMQQFVNGGPRQRAQVPASRPSPNYYFPMQRYPTNVPGPGAPQFHYQYTGQAQYQQYVHSPQMTQQQMFNPGGYPPQYPQQTPQQQQIAPAPPVPQMIPQQQPQSQKRERRIIRIVDPNTNQDVTDDIINNRSDSLSTPPSGRSSATPPTQGDVAAKFAAQVAVAAGTSKSASPLVTPPIDTQSIMINTNQLMAQMTDQQIVGSPSMGVPNPMAQSNQPYVNMPGQVPSPRPPSVPTPTQQAMRVPQQFVSMSVGPGSHPPPQMLPASPGHAQMHGPTGMPPSIQEQMSQASFQLTQPQAQQFAGSTHTPIRHNIPDNIYPPQSVPLNVASGEPSALPQPSQVQTVQQIARPTVPQQQAPQAEALAQTVPSSVTTDMSHTELPPSQPVFPVQVATPPVAAPEMTSVQDVKSVETSRSEKPADQTRPVVPHTASEGAKDLESAAVSTAVAGGDTPPIVQASESMTKTVAEKPDNPVNPKPVDQVPLKPDETEQPPVEEDTALRLEDQNKPITSIEKEDPISADVKSTKGIDLPTTVAETSEKVEAKLDVPPSRSVSEMEPAKRKDAPVVNVVPPTPPIKAQAPQQQTEKKAIGSLKEDVGKAEEKTKSPEMKTDVQPNVVESQQSKPRTKSPELQRRQRSEGSQGKTTRKDSPAKQPPSPSDKQQKTPALKPQSSQKVTEKTVANGLDSSTETDASKVAKKTDEQSVKPVDAKASADSKTPQPKCETSGSPLPPSEKPSSEKSQEFEKTNGVAPGKSKTASDIKYDDDQWSPLNPKGKRQYDSIFLLQFQYKPTSLEKPKDLPDIDIVLHQPHKQIANPIQPMEIRGGADFTPPYMRGQQRRPGRQNSRDHHYRMGRSSMSGPGQRVIQKVVSIDRDVELKTTENAWKPTKRDKNLGKVPADEQETLEVIREVRSILNKLTPSTFTPLMQQVLALKIDSEKKLRGTIDLIFEKAIDEPNFSEAYANMCRQMTQIRVTPTEPATADQNAPGPPTVEFRKLLLTKCQKEFEKNKSDQEHLLELKKKMEENKDADIAPQLKEEYELAEFKERRRTLGNIRFIGELFKLRMLTESIMHNCIMTLFKARDDDHLESLCRLLTTIGKDLDHVKGKQRMDQYFDQIMKIIQEKRTSSRVRFMLQDVHDLRLNNWVPRAIVTQGPKTITQIHQDAKQEQELLQLKLANTAAPPPMKQGGRQQNRMGSRGHGEDGWTKVQTPAKPTRYDPNKMKLKPNQFDESKVTLGPSRGFMGWKSGSAGSGLSKSGSGGYSPSGSMDRTQETARSNTPTSMKNRFSALSQGQGPDYDSQRRQPGRQSSREGSRTGSRGSMGPPSSGGRTPRKDERSSVLEATRKITSVERSQDSRQRLSRESSPSVKQRPSAPQQQQSAHKYNANLTEDLMQQKSKNILEEFLSIVDFKEATECIEELNAPPSLMHSLVYVAHEFTLEKKGEERVNIGRLMAHLLKLGRLSAEQYMKGLAELLEMGSDYEIDVPKVWEYFAEQLYPVFENDKEGDIPLTCLAELAGPLRDEEKSGIFVAEVVKAILKRVAMEDFVRRWQRSNMLWSNIIGKNDDSIESFLSRHNLSELSDSKGPSRDRSTTWQTTARPSAADEQYRLEQDIRELLDKNVENDDIFAWVEKNVQIENLVKPPFLRALTIAVCKKALDIKDGYNVVEDRISERGLVLKKFMDGDPERELQALFALQRLMVDLEQPANVLRKFFDVLYNEDVVSEQTFYKWEKSDDPNEQDGRGVAVASVNPFFTFLRTAEPESD